MENTDFLTNYVCEGQLLKLYTYPHPILAKKATPVTRFDEDLRELCKNMLYTMYQSPGIGLAAPQIGQSLRIFVVDVEYKREKRVNAEGKEEIELSHFHPIILINPKLRDPEGSITCQEGCLSLPGIYEDVERARKIHVDYFDVYGEQKTLVAEELLAVCIQHENDHLDGVVLLDRLGQLKRALLKKKLMKQKKLAKIS